MKVLMSNHSDQNAGRRGVWYASARLNVQCYFHNQQNIAIGGRKKKKIIIMYQSKNRQRWLFICVTLLNRRNLTKALLGLALSSKFSFFFFFLNEFFSSKVSVDAICNDWSVRWGWNLENWRESFGDFMYFPIHYLELLKIKFTIN